MSEDSKICAVPLEMYGDAIIKYAEKLGVPHPCVIVILGDPTSGDVNTISNLSDEYQITLLKFLLDNRLNDYFIANNIPVQEKH